MHRSNALDRGVPHIDGLASGQRDRDGGRPGHLLSLNCSGSYGASATVPLSATAAIGSTFAGWSGACTGTGACDVAISADRAVTATFVPATTTPTTGSNPPPSAPPSISSLKQSAPTWRERGKPARRNAKKKLPPLGTTFSFAANEPATVTLTFTQPVPGRRASGKCVAQTRSNKHKPRCVLIRIAGQQTLSAHPGTNDVRFQGRVSRTHKLRPGRYTLTIAASNTAGERTTTSRSLNFTIVK